MSTDRVVILGGGPVGLICAIEARKYFNSIWIIEKRSDYTRLNVPTISDSKLRPYLHKVDTELHTAPKLGMEHHKVTSASFSSIEKTLLKKAEEKDQEKVNAHGVVMLRPYVVTKVVGCGQTSAQKGSKDKPPTRFKQIVLTIRAWDDKTKKVVADARPIVCAADLVVVATGGGAIADSLITETFGFTYEKLKAKNYMAYGVFEKISPLDEPSENKEYFEKVSERITGGKGFAPESIEDHQYYLPTLSGITKTDFNNLRKSQDLLKRLVVALKAGYSTSDGILESLKEVEKNVLAFKIKIQRARQFYSPTLPAVLVGDAAVTPHPDTGSGFASGFRGCEVLVELFEALKDTNPKDDVVKYQNFNDQYELHVSKKALDGTKSIIEGHIHLLDRYASEMKGLAKASKSPEVVEYYNTQESKATELTAELKKHQDLAQSLYVHIKRWDEQLPNLEPGETAGKLWSRLGETYGRIKELTKDETLLDRQLSKIENKLLGPEKGQS